jgi:translation initiation factor 1
MGKRKSHREVVADEPAEPFNNPFGALGGVRAAAVPASVPDAPVAAPAQYSGKLVIQRERKGHGGKTVTILRGVSMELGALAAFARELGNAFGGSARVVGADVVLSGNQCTRLAKWLADKGAQNVVVGN